MIKKFSILLQVFVLTAVSIIGLMIVPATIHACSCAESASAQAELQQQTAVFSGKVIAIKKPFKLLIRSSADPVNVTFEVDRVWKGDVGKIVSIQTAMSEASCGFNFDQNQEYLVYAYGNIADLRASLCSRTQAFLTASEDVEALGTPLKSPIEELSPDDSIPNRSVLYYILAVGSLVAVILTFVVVLRKRLRS
jgi:hypothetical protein